MTQMVLTAAGFLNLSFIVDIYNGREPTKAKWWQRARGPLPKDD